MREKNNYLLMGAMAATAVVIGSGMLIYHHYVHYELEGNGDADENNPIGMIVLSPFVKSGYANSISYSHASLVKTIEEIYNLNPLLGFAGDKTTNDLSDFFVSR